MTAFYYGNPLFLIRISFQIYAHYFVYTTRCETRAGCMYFVVLWDVDVMLFSKYILTFWRNRVPPFAGWWGSRFHQNFVYPYTKQNDITTNKTVSVKSV